MSTEHLDHETQDAICESLEILSHADEYYRWLCSRVSMYIRGRVLEIGAGIGTFSQWASHLASEYHPTDVDPRLVARLRKTFPHAFEWNVFDPFPGSGMYDTIVILNVIEHLKDDLGALRALAGLLAPGGHIIVMVPAMGFLYGTLDRAFGHFRRYNKKMMQRLFGQVPFKFVMDQYVNVIGMFGWFLYGRILRVRNLPPHLCSRFNLVLPLLKLERPLASLTGLSLISIGQR